VTYAVDQTLKGSPPPQVTVQHIVVTGAETAEPGDEPSLAKKLFRPGARFVVMATLGDDGAWYSLDERHGAIPFSADTLAMVRAMIAEV
jgi:hypothetical protein